MFLYNEVLYCLKFDSAKVWGGTVEQKRQNYKGPFSFCQPVRENLNIALVVMTVLIPLLHELRMWWGLKAILVGE